MAATEQEEKRVGNQILRNLRIQGKTFEKKLPGNPALEPDLLSAHCIFLPAWLSSLRGGHLSASSRLLGITDSKEVTSWEGSSTWSQRVLRGAWLLNTDYTSLLARKFL